MLGALKDFFWTGDNRFDPDNAEPFPGVDTLLYYLHGALHLIERRDKVAFKQVAGLGNLLEQFAASTEVPLFVSEGTAEQKFRAIRSSDYLWHCYEALRRYSGNLVVFGSSLAPQDAHIVRAVLANPGRSVAVAIYPSSPDAVILTKMHVRQILAGVNELIFYDSRTHPLGDASLTIAGGV
ncbi:DUF4917 family protein [Pyxidicoccus sp. 3LG]